MNKITQLFFDALAPTRTGRKGGEIEREKHHQATRDRDRKVWTNVSVFEQKLSIEWKFFNF